MPGVEKPGPTLSHTCPAAASPAKSRGALRLCSSLLRVFFKLNALALANPIFTMLKSLEGTQFPKADEVTLRYYEGRFAVFEEKYVSARLSFQCVRVLLSVILEGGMGVGRSFMVVGKFSMLAMI